MNSNSNHFHEIASIIAQRFPALDLTTIDEKALQNIVYKLAEFTPNLTSGLEEHTEAIVRCWILLTTDFILYP